MTTISRNALVPYSPAEMYALVEDIERYPHFLPWCKRACILYSDPDEVRATIELSKHGIEASFTTRNRLQKHKMIEMRLMKGPFHHLQGFWRFEPLSDSSCRVSLDIDFEISNVILRVTLGPIFNQITNSLVDAFVRRAREVYGYR